MIHEEHKESRMGVDNHTPSSSPNKMNFPRNDANFPRLSAHMQANPTKQPPPFPQNLAYGEDPEKNLWLFWDSFETEDGQEKEISEFQHLCFQTIGRNKGSFRLYLITQDNVLSYLDAALPGNLPSSAEGPSEDHAAAANKRGAKTLLLKRMLELMLPAQQKDFSLSSLIAKYGGIAMDMSIILLPNRLDLMWDAMKLQKQDSMFWIRDAWAPKGNTGVAEENDLLQQNTPWRDAVGMKGNPLYDYTFQQTATTSSESTATSSGSDEFSYPPNPRAPQEYTLVWLIFGRRNSKIMSKFWEMATSAMDLFPDSTGYAGDFPYFFFGREIFDQILYPLYYGKTTFRGKKLRDVFSSKSYDDNAAKKNFDKVSWRDVYCTGCEVKIPVPSRDSKNSTENDNSETLSEQKIFSKSGHGDSLLFPSKLRFTGENFFNTNEWFKWREEDGCFSGPVPRFVGIKFFRAGRKFGGLSREELLELDPPKAIGNIGTYFHLAGIRDMAGETSDMAGIGDNSPNSAPNLRGGGVTGPDSTNTGDIETLLRRDVCAEGVLFTRPFMFAVMGSLFGVITILIFVILYFFFCAKRRVGHRHRSRCRKSTETISPVL